MLTNKQVIDICNEESRRIVKIHPNIVFKAGFDKLPKTIYDYCMELNNWWEAAKAGKQLKTGQPSMVKIQLVAYKRSHKAQMGRKEVIMTPNKRKTIKGHRIEQFYWTGKDVVYIDNRLTAKTFDEITAETVDIVYRATWA